MLAYTVRQGHSIYGPVEYGNALVHRARNEALSANISRGSDFCLFIDDDMVPEETALEKLIQNNVPVCSALCTTRVPPVRFAASVWSSETNEFGVLDRIRPDKLVSGPFAVGFAFLLIRKDALSALREYYLSAKDWIEENRRMFDRLRVKAELREQERKRREEIRRARWETGKHLRVFDYLVGDDEWQLGEDVAVSKRLLRLGYEIAIDPRVKVGHLGEHAYGPWDLNEDFAN